MGKEIVVGVTGGRLEKSNPYKPVPQYRSGVGIKLIILGKYRY
jgi:hypothetical protein